MATVFKTATGVPYLKEPGVELIATPHFDFEKVKEFLGGFDKELGFDDYTKDRTWIQHGSRLAKFAGQLCYLSFGPKRTKNADADKYFSNITEQKHFSVVEHANFSFLFYGISRSLTHELVRHRHFSYSQVSQRYVGQALLRFVERPEFQADPELHEIFEKRIERVSEEYGTLTDRLVYLQTEGARNLSGERLTELRKKVRQAARACLTNEVEAPIVVTGNIRSFREFLEKRANEHAEVEIRKLALGVYHELNEVEPLLLQDFKIADANDGTQLLTK